MIILLIGLILLAGYASGFVAGKLGLPKVTGYFLVGILLSPDLNRFVDPNFPILTEPITDLCLAFITFEVGCTLSAERLKEHGKGILLIATLESLGAFILVLFGFWAFMPLLTDPSNTHLTVLTVCVLLGALATPTDPSATLAVMHEYKARGVVSETIMGAAALDDAIALLLFGLSFSVASSTIGLATIPISGIIYHTFMIIMGAVLVGILLGWFFNVLTRLLKVNQEGQIIVLVIGFLSLAFGLSVVFGFDALFSTLTFGIVVANFNRNSEKIIGISERYTEELVFIFFFVLGAMHLKWQSLSEAILLIGLFITLRLIGKLAGTYSGAKLSKMPRSVSKFAFAGLIPQGGIVLGLALMIQKDPVFSEVSDLIIGVVMGATLIHEFIGPITSKWALKRAGEI